MRLRTTLGGTGWLVPAGGSASCAIGKHRLMRTALGLGCALGKFLVMNPTVAAHDWPKAIALGVDLVLAAIDRKLALCAAYAWMARHHNVQSTLELLGPVCVCCCRTHAWVL